MSSSLIKGVNFHLKPQAAWMAIIGLICLSVLLILAGASSLMNLLFPLAALAVGIFLYLRAPVIYVGFTWWLWFITPVIRRLSDWRGSYTEPSPMLVAPFLVSLITLITVWRNLPIAHRQGGLPFIFPCLAVLYGVCVGFIYREPTAVVIRGFDWLAPLPFAFHIYANWRNYPNYRQNLQKVFFWGVLVMGVYGIFQFMLSPPWDAMWLVKSGFLSGSEGRPDEGVPRFSIYVWSTMTSNRPFATVMMAGLIWLFANENKGKLGFLASIAGYLSILLARKRTVWFTLIMGIFIYGISLKGKRQIRTIIALIITVFCIAIIINLEPFSSFIYSRIETISNLQEDNSANSRLGWFNLVIGDALLSFFGEGIGGDNHDSGILNPLFNIGWFGIILYFGGLLISVIRMFCGGKFNEDPFILASRAIAVAILLEIPLGSPYLEAPGMVLWSAIAIVLAAKKYYSNQRKLKT